MAGDHHGWESSLSPIQKWHHSSSTAKMISWRGASGRAVSGAAAEKEKTAQLWSSRVPLIGTMSHTSPEQTETHQLQRHMSINLTSLVSCRQISHDCDRVHGERLAGFLSPGKIARLLIHAAWFLAE